MNSKLKSAIINIILLAIVVFLAIKVVQSISAPIRFGKEKSAREAEVIQRLKDIRDAEMQFKQVYNKYTSNFDSLIEFCNTNKIPIVNIIADPNDTTFTRTINDTLGYIKVADSLFGKRPNFNINDIRYIPYSDPQVEFDLRDSIIVRGGINVPVFEAKAPYEIYLNGLEDQRVRNAKAEQEQIDKYAGMKVGSLEEASTDGNWEKL